MPALTVQNAEIKTAAVEVKTLTISGKQVTLAVFRQLREETLLHVRDATLAGTPWGTVNYHPGRDCDGVGQHLHVVWQCGTELRRSTIRKPEFRSAIAVESGSEWLAARLLEGHEVSLKKLKLSAFDGVYEVEWVDRAIEIYVPDECHGMPHVPDEPDFERGSDPAYEYRWSWYDRDVAKHEKWLADLRGYAARMNIVDSATEAKRVDAEIAEELALRAALLQRWQEFNDLPQLFIAV